jgi:phosphoserine aminotransferase
VLEEVQREWLDFAGTGMSLIELSHRSATYERVHDDALRRMRTVSEAPDDFEIVFIQGGATLQFSMVPLNLLAAETSAGYVVSGSWGRRAYTDAKAHGQAYAAWDGAKDGYTRMPWPDEVSIRDGTRYLHITTNETIEGIRMPYLPEVEVPMVADVSSDYLARRLPWDRFDLVYGGVQKNLGPAGLAVVFVRQQILDNSRSDLGSFLRYQWHAAGRSLAHTPAMFSIYVMAKVLRLIEEQGGVSGLEAASTAKAGLIYEVIDKSDGFYSSPVERAHRSHMNVVWRMPSVELEADFLAAAEKQKLIGLRGHRSIGGCRASLYAGMGMDSVETLAEFMEDFARQTTV